MFTRTPHPETCAHCPMRDSGKPCPAYVSPDNGFVEQKLGSDETRVVSGCFFQIVPKLMVHLIQAANRSSVISQQVRNELEAGIDTIGRAVITGTEVLLRHPHDPTLLEDRSDGKE